MENALFVDPGVYEKIPDLVLLSGYLEIGEPDLGGISAYLNDSWTSLAEEVKTLGHSGHPRVVEWRKALQAAGVSVKKFPPSIQAMAKRTLRSDSPFSISPVVDTYNALSMELIVPSGAYDVHQMEGGLELRVSGGGESFSPIGRAETSLTLPGEIVYSDGADVLTRQFLWQQSEKAKITRSTRRVVFVFEFLSGMGEEFIEKAVRKIEDRFRTLLDAEVSGLYVHRK